MTDFLTANAHKDVQKDEAKNYEKIAEDMKGEVTTGPHPDNQFVIGPDIKLRALEITAGLFGPANNNLDQAFSAAEQILDWAASTD